MIAARNVVWDSLGAKIDYEYNPDIMRLYIVGGGGCLVKNFGEYDAGRVTILDDICATAKEYEYLSRAGLERKSAA